MAQVQCGQVPEPESPIDALVYVALQELATRISHLNTGQAVDDPAGYEVLKRVASDENRHYLFYRDLVAEALEVDPSWTLQSIDRQVRGFEMPGTGIVDFATHAKAIARAGIYDFAVHHDQILQPVLVTPLEARAPRGARRRRRGGPGLGPALHGPGRQGRRTRRLAPPSSPGRPRV